LIGQQNYFSDLYSVNILDLSAKPFFPCKYIFDILEDLISMTPNVAGFLYSTCTWKQRYIDKLTRLRLCTRSYGLLCAHVYEIVRGVKL